MNGNVNLNWVRDQLASRTGLSKHEAGEAVRAAIIAGEISAFAPRVSYSPANPSQAVNSGHFGHKTNYQLPSKLWETLKIDWDKDNPFFNFYDEHGVYLVSQVHIASEQAYKFLAFRDPTSKFSQVEPERRKGTGGAPPKIDWERCLIEAARWMYASKAPNQQAELIRYIADQLGPTGPGDTQLKAHLAPLWRAFREVDRER